jgi:hypothetical protein
MSDNPESKSLARLMAEADELIQQFNSEAIKDLEEEHRLAFEKHAQNYEKIKVAVHSKIEKKGTLDTSGGTDGMHEAIRDIVKAFGEFTKFHS